ncbi:MAG TPA: Rid family hydrolase [Caldilineaceae bacterium]|nr:Rid family hydrolase [Caldilineaceae bacterium]
MRKPIIAEKGAKPKGPYTPAIVAQGPLVFVSAQGPFDPATGQIEAQTFRDQAKQVFDNITVLLEAAGATWADVVKVQVFLADFADFAVMNEVYSQYVQEPYPARTTVHSKIGASDIAVDCIAVLPQA